MLWKLDTNNGDVTQVGSTGFPGCGDLALFDGNLYYYTRELGGFTGIVKVDLTNTSNSTIVVTMPITQFVSGLSASPFAIL